MSVQGGRNLTTYALESPSLFRLAPLPSYNIIKNKGSLAAGLMFFNALLSLENIKILQITQLNML